MNSAIHLPLIGLAAVLTLVGAAPAREPLAAIPPLPCTRRAGLKEEIQALSKQRAAWISARLKEQEGGVEASLDHNIYRAVRSQAADSGLTYGADAAKY